MKKKYLLAVFLVLIICSFILINRPSNGLLTYITAIDKVYNSNINGMSFSMSRVNNFYRCNERLLNVEAGNRENNFSANSNGGVKLWEAKQLFLNIKNLKVLREGLPETLANGDTEYYFIITSQVYYGNNKLNIHYLEFYINTKNYHIYMPKYYDEPDKLLNSSILYVEYEPDEITKKLINDIISVN